MIKMRDICRYFEVGDETVKALDHVTLDIARGDYISIMGASGSGKSTLLNMIVYWICQTQEVINLKIKNSLPFQKRKELLFDVIILALSFNHSI